MGLFFSVMPAKVNPSHLLFYQAAQFKVFVVGGWKLNRRVQINQRGRSVPPRTASL
jgi:hypothetical protein